MSITMKHVVLSNVRRPTINAQRLTSNAQCPTCNVQLPKSSIQRPSVQRPNVQSSTSNVQCPNVQRVAHVHSQLFGHTFAFTLTSSAVSHGHLGRGLHLSTTWTNPGPMGRPCPLLCLRRRSSLPSQCCTRRSSWYRCCSLAPVKEKLVLLPPRSPNHETALLLPSRSGRPRPQPPSRHLGFSRSLWAGSLGLLHQQWPVPVDLVHIVFQCLESRKAFFHGTAAYARSGSGGLSSWPSHGSRRSGPLSSTEASLVCAQRIFSTLPGKRAGNP